MTVRQVAYTVLLLSLPSYDGEAAQVNDVQSQLSLLVAKVDRAEISRIDIIQIPSTVVTRTAITPEMLENQFHYRLTIRDIRNSTYRDEFLKSMESIKIERENARSDLRWGVILYSTDGTRVGEIYIDESGDHGSIKGTSVAVRGSLHKWLSQNFAMTFK